MNLLTSFLFSVAGIFFAFTAEWLYSPNKSLHTGAIFLIVCAVVAYMAGHISLNMQKDKSRKEGYEQGVKEAAEYKKCLDKHNLNMD